MTKEEYLNNPCGTSSIPLWKAQEVLIPNEMKIVHDADFDESMLESYYDEPYFRLKHTLHDLTTPELPEHFHFCSASADEYAKHINSCYANLRVTADELRDYTARPVYCSDLWLVIKDDRTGMIAASGIGEVDREIAEGVLEWIQVSNDFRGLGLGRCVVQELLYRMKGKAAFATISGQCNNPSKPEALYRKCGFTGTDIWHILRKR